MERIVNGHYADPNSTRDIVGIKPEQFEVIIAALKQLHATCFTFLAATKESQVEFIEKVMDTEIADDIVRSKPTKEDISIFFIEKTDKMISYYNLSYEILQQINQPYPGGSYPETNWV